MKILQHYKRTLHENTTAIIALRFKSTQNTEVALATRDWSGRLPFPIHSNKRNAQNYYNIATQKYNQLLKMMVTINKYSYI